MSDERKRDGAMRIFEALSSVDEELLVRSEAKKNVVPFWRYSKVMAACICLVVLGAATFASTRIASDNASSSDCAAPMEEMAVADAEAPDMMDMESETDVDGAMAEEAGEEYNLMHAAADDAEAKTAEPETDKLVETDMLTEDKSGMIMDWGPVENAPELVDEKTLRDTEAFGSYIPTMIPAGYVFADGSRVSEDDETSGISISWTKGMDYIFIGVSEFVEEEDAPYLVDVSEPETYDVRLYEIPYADSVPDEVRTTFNTPIFKESDFSVQVIEARMKSVEEAGDTDTPGGNFAVLYDSGILVSFTGRGEVQEIWEMFESIHAE